MISEILEQAVRKALKTLGIEAPEIVLEHPADLAYGDYATNAAMVLAKKTRQNPRELAEQIAAELRKDAPKEVAKIEVAGPGFINFRLTDDFFADETKRIRTEGEKFGKNKKLKAAKTVIEYTDPNPFKEFHIGHLMPNAIGESIARIAEANGANVIRACYQGDVGLHVAKAIWGIRQAGAPAERITAAALGKAYAAGAQAYEADDAAKQEIVALNKSIYDRNDAGVNTIYDAGRKASLDYFESIYKILGTTFDEYFFESETGPIGKRIVEEHAGDVFKEGENGAVIFPGEQYGLHTRVFINAEGIPTYEAKELGLSKLKYDRTKYDASIIVTGNEINEYFKVLLKAMGLIFPDLAARTSHVSHGMLRLPSGKMSSRTGDVITAVSLIADVKEKILGKMSDRDMSDAEKAAVAEEVAVGAIKYSILRQVTGKDIIFDFDKSLSFEGDSGPYLQYSYARARSVLRKAADGGVKADAKKGAGRTDDLAKLLARFPEVVARAGAEYAPHHIATYLIEIASAFNAYYAGNKIVDAADPSSPHKVALTEAFAAVMRNGLDLLGIAAPERM